MTMILLASLVCLCLLFPVQLVAFDPHHLVGETYKGLFTGQRTSVRTIGSSSGGPRPPHSPSHFPSPSGYQLPKGGLTSNKPADTGPPSIHTTKVRNPGPGITKLKPVLPSALNPAGPHPPSQPHRPFTGAVCDDPPSACVAGKYRTADGSCNNLEGHPAWGMAGRPQERLLPPVYHNGKDTPRLFGVRGQPLPSPRDVSQVLHPADSKLTESPDLSLMFTMWGQFLDHDITHTPVATDTDGSKLDCCNQPPVFPARDLYYRSGNGRPTQRNDNPNCFPITLFPLTDRFFKTSCMNFVRSKPFAPSPTCHSDTREQGNSQTSFLDASQVYGSSLGDQGVLRTWLAGQLKSSRYDLLPENSTTMCTKRPSSRDFCFGAGDTRVNEHPMLSSIHTVFHRYHNTLASHLSYLNPHWNDETLYQETRKIIGAIMQRVTYAEYLPLVLGEREMARYNLTLDGARPYVYDPYLNPNIFNSFSTAAFRFGHSMVHGKNSFGYQTVDLRDMFFHPHFVQRGRGRGLTMLLNGLVRDRSQSRDRFMNTDLTDQLFRTRQGRSLDLVSLNVQRGRDHGLPAYDHFRQLCGLPSLKEAVAMGKFADVPFLRVYRDLEDVDLFSGGLTEGVEERGSVVGPTFSCLLARQFHALKFGDRFWYQNTLHPGAFTPEQIRTIEGIKLSDVLCATGGMTAVQTFPFIKASAGNRVRECSSLTPVDLYAWKEL
ncbi:thyroid peroxidase-like [Babylonia areolata]|uniref:thyroid peroxidase-like n=1 Tax=Babylonia areolata TaxID=304850 RepID=UPI003FD69C38